MVLAKCAKGREREHDRFSKEMHQAFKNKDELKLEKTVISFWIGTSTSTHMKHYDKEKNGLPRKLHNAIECFNQNLKSNFLTKNISIAWEKLSNLWIVYSQKSI